MQKESPVLTNLLTENPDPVLCLDASGAILYSNPASQQMFAALHHTDPNHAPEDWQPLITRTLQGEKTGVVHYQGNGLIFSLTFVPVGEHINVYGHDITVRKQTEEALQQSEKRHRQMFERNQAVMLLIDPESGVIVDANPAACRFYGYSHEAMTKMRISDINTLPQEQVKLEMAWAASQQRAYFIFRHRVASGRVHDVEVHSSPIEVQGKTLLYSIVRDITERKNAEQALRNSEEHLQSLITSMDDLVFSVDLEGHLLVYHEGHEQSSLPPEHFVGVPFQEVLPAQIVKRFENSIRRVITTMQTQQLDYSMIGDKEERYFSARLSPLRDSDLRLVGVTVVSREITEAVRTRQRQQRMFDLEQLHRHIASLFWNTEDIDGALSRTLALAGEFFDVSRAYVFQVREGESLIDNTHEWCAPGIKPEIDNLKSIPFEEVVPSLMQMLTRDGIIAPKDISELPEDLQNILSTEGVRTILNMPLYVDRRLHGFVGFNEMRHPRQWLPEEIATIRTIAESYSRALERHRAQAALIQARDTALRSVKLKSEFMANMSHEVRTPMTGVIGMLELLLETDLSDEQREFADAAYSSAHNLLDILNDILDFSKIEAGKIILEMKPIDVRHIANEVITTLTTQATRKNITLTAHVADQIPSRVFGDATRLRQVLMNLTNNAVKFTNEGGVEIRVSQAGNASGRIRLHFEVVDSGIGIAPEQHERIFDSFVQADGSTTRKHGGSGLGLSISQQLVQLMGGHLQVHSELGKGSTFSFNLTFPVTTGKAGLSSITPLNLVVVDKDQAARSVLAQQLRVWGMHVTELEKPELILETVTKASQEGRPVDVLFYHATTSIADQEKLIAPIRAKLGGHPPLLVCLTDESQVVLKPGIFDKKLYRPISQSDLYDLLSSINPVLEGVAGQLAAKLPSQGRILLAEDQEVNQRIVMQTLRQAGFQVDAAANGYEVLDLLKHNDYDLILMDVHMPEMDGLSATRNIRALDGPKSKTPVIALTASVMLEEQQQYFDAGVNAVWGKPFSLEQLRTNVRQWTEK